MNSIGSEFLWGNKAKNRTCNATQMVDSLAVIRFFINLSMEIEHFYIKVFERKFHIFQFQIWGPTFYFTKNVQNEHFYKKVFERKFHIFQFQIWGPTFHFTKNVQNEHFYIKVFERKFHIFQFQIWDPYLSFHQKCSK